jgi:hypothetical protein
MPGGRLTQHFLADQRNRGAAEAGAFAELGDQDFEVVGGRTLNSPGK